MLLRRHYDAKIAVSEGRLNYITAMDIDTDYFFTNDMESTWIEVISRSQRQAKIKENAGSIAVTLTGWANLDQAYPDGQNCYIVPYSLHSNFREMEQLVRVVRPRTLIGVVNENNGKWDRFGKSSSSHKSYMFSLMGIKQRGLQFLREQYC